MYKKRFLPLCIALISSGNVAYAQDADKASIDDIIVTGVRSAELNARQDERNKRVFSSVISQDDAGLFADQNVAESLQRLPGITLQKSEGEGRFISVRGLGPGFVTVQQNGAEMASAGSDDRSFALDAIPADSLAAIEVFKSLTPDMDLNSIGGTVNVKTVSAFDRKKDTLRLSLQDYYQDYQSDHSPKISLQGTNLFLGDTIGVGYSASWEKRNTQTYEMLHHETTDMRFVQQDLPTTTPKTDDLSSYMLIPFEFQNRQETAERERTAVSLDLGWRPKDGTELYMRGSYTEYTDMDIAWREYYRFGQAGTDDIVYLDPTNNIFGVVDADIQQQMFIQDGVSETTSYALGGKHDWNADGGQWDLDYEYAWSKSTFKKPEGKRVQFRERDVPLLAKAGKDYIVAQAINGADLAALAGHTLASAGLTNDQIGAYTANGISLAGFDFDNLFLEDSSRSDEINALTLNLRRSFDDGIVSYLKVGISIKERERQRNQDRWSLTPSSFSPQCADAEDPLLCRQYINSNLTDHDYARVDHPDFVYPAITRKGTEHLIHHVRAIANPETQQGLESIYRDYQLNEDSFAAYVMGEFRLADNQFLTAGVRWDETKFSSTGYLAINNDNFDIGDGSAVSYDYSIPLPAEENKYDNLLPSIHYRYEPREDVLVRASIWTSFTRPSFDQARAFATLDSNFELCNPSTGKCGTTPTDTLNAGDPPLTAADIRHFTLGENNTLRLGNPNLVAMTSVNYDFSIGWYADEDLFLQAALFYKDIDDFIVDVQGVRVNLADLPTRLPVDQVDGFIIPQDLNINNVNWTTNGDKAKVYGIELSYIQNFSSGFFIQSNMTFMNSEANAGDTVRVGKIALPEQADTTGNLTVGWENNQLSLRLIGNYTSEILKRIGSCPEGSEDYLIAMAGDSRSTCKKWADIYQNDTYGLDFKATYKFNKNLNVYFDAINLTDQYMTKFYRGNGYSGGNVMYHSEVYGRSYQMGINYLFK